MDSFSEQQETLPIVGLVNSARVDVHRTYLFTSDIRMGRIAGLKPSDFLLMMVIKSHVGRYTGEARIGTRLLSAQSGLGRSTVFECLKRLSAAGFIEYHPSQRDGDRNTFKVLDTIPIKIGHKRVGVLRCVFTPQELNTQVDLVKRVLADAKQSATEGQNPIDKMSLALMKFSTQEQGRFIRAFGFDENGEVKAFAAASSMSSQELAETNARHVEQVLSHYRATEPQQKCTLPLPLIETVDDLAVESVVALQ